MLTWNSSKCSVLAGYKIVDYSSFHQWNIYIKSSLDWIWNYWLKSWVSVRRYQNDLELRFMQRIHIINQKNLSKYLLKKFYVVGNVLIFALNQLHRRFMNVLQAKYGLLRTPQLWCQSVKMGTGRMSTWLLALIVRRWC